MGRSSILIKGLSARLGIPWSLAKEWAPIARDVLSGKYAGNPTDQNKPAQNENRVRFREVLLATKLWTKGRLSKVVRRLPDSWKRRLANMVLEKETRASRKKISSR